MATERVRFVFMGRPNKSKPGADIAPVHREKRARIRRQQNRKLTEAGKLHVLTPEEVRAFAAARGIKCADDSVLEHAFEQATDADGDGDGT